MYISIQDCKHTQHVTTNATVRFPHFETISMRKEQLLLAVYIIVVWVLDRLKSKNHLEHMCKVPHKFAWSRKSEY